MKRTNSTIKIVLTGPESTGKSTLAKQLAAFYNTAWYPEYAREYIQNLNRGYTYSDVIKIIDKQIENFEKVQNPIHNDLVFFDTGLIISKIWLLEKFNKLPSYIDEAIKSINIDLYLLCYPDVDWVPDDVRENGGSKRMELFYKYKEELEKNNCNYLIVKGKERERFLQVTKYISSAYCL